MTGVSSVQSWHSKSTLKNTNRRTTFLIDQQHIAKKKAVYLGNLRTIQTYWTMKKLTYISVDGDGIDQLMVVSFVNRFPHSELAGAFLSAEKALHFCQDNLVDVIFLDIDMPGMDGLKLRKALAAIPACIFVTSHPEHVVESFQSTLSILS